MVKFIAIQFWEKRQNKSCSQVSSGAMVNVDYMMDIQDIWTKARNYLREQMTADCYQRWIGNIVPVRLEGKEIILGVPSSMFCDWLNYNYKDVIEESFKITSSLKLKAVFESGHEPLPEPEEAESKSLESADAAASAVCAGNKETNLAPKSSIQSLDRRFTFETFVVGENNMFAYNACRAVANNPGTNMNPLFIHSSTGLGKTHLLQGIAHDVIARNPKANVMYVNSEDFLNQYIEAMYKNSFAAFRKKFRSLDVLLIDDVQFIGSKQGFQEEIFHTFNALYNAHKQIVLTSDRPPHEIGGLEKRLVSRFEWGLTTEMLPPDLETRIAIIHKKQEEQEYKLDEEVVRYVAARLKSNVRRLESSICKLVSWASLSNTRIDVASAEKLLSNVFNEEASAVLSIEDIQKIVAEYYDIRLADMTSKRRPANIALPRQVAMFFARKMTDLSLSAIADKFSRNHATILHAVSAVDEKLSDSEFKREIGLIERKLRSN